MQIATKQLDPLGIVAGVIKSLDLINTVAVIYSLKSAPWYVLNK